MNEARDESSLLIAIDGPSGAGKSSTSRGVAQRLGLAYLDTGSVYRAAAVAWLETDIPATEAEAITELVAETVIEVGTDPSAPTVSVNGRDVTDEIREPRVAGQVSTIATIQPIRDIVTEQFRQVIDAHGRRIVVEGRDITTVVAPDADVRVLLVADPAARIARRQAELGGQTDQAQVVDQIVRRDRDDSTVSQFETPAEGVTLLDSTHLSLPEVIEVIVEMVPAR